MFPFRLPENAAAPTPEPAAPVVVETPAAPVLTQAPRALEPLDA